MKKENISSLTITLSCINFAALRQPPQGFFFVNSLTSFKRLPCVKGAGGLPPEGLFSPLSNYEFSFSFLPFLSAFFCHSERSEESPSLSTAFRRAGLAPAEYTSTRRKTPQTPLFSPRKTSFFLPKRRHAELL